MVHLWFAGAFFQGRLGRRLPRSCDLETKNREVPLKFVENSCNLQRWHVLKKIQLFPCQDGFLWPWGRQINEEPECSTGSGHVGWGTTSFPSNDVSTYLGWFAGGGFSTDSGNKGFVGGGAMTRTVPGLTSRVCLLQCSICHLVN